MRAGVWWLAGTLLAAAPITVSGQAMIEYTLGVGRAAATAPAMKKAGEASAKTFEKLGQMLEQGGQARAGVTSSRSTIPLAPEAPKRVGPFLDPLTLTAGLTREELLNRYGDPVMKTTGGVGTLAGETYWYRTPTGEHILAEVREGQVAAVSTEAQRKQASSAVVIVQ
ncbi:MAG: hypothetical protein FJW34_20665 [Acidobacteria bacterium]|nr:hypothetical protein [Acidobacteriota bacterium]